MPHKQKKEGRTETFLATKRDNDIINLAIKGMSVNDMAEYLGVTEENVRQIMNKIERRWTIDTQDKRERFITVTNVRLEWLLFKILDAIDRQTSEEKDKISGPSRDMINAAMTIIKYQDTLTKPEGTNMSDIKVQINQTFSASDTLYDQALQGKQQEAIGYTVHKVDEPMVVNLPPELARLEDLATKFGETSINDFANTEPDGPASA